MRRRRPPIAIAVAVLCAVGSAQNSTHRERPPPSGVAARAGSAVAWRADLETARAQARRAGLPVFRYVPTLAGSPMDRTAELDRYMLAGPFSDGDVVALLNACFVPVRAAGRRGEAGLAPGEFIEPGFVVESSDGVEVLRRHALVTLHADWFLAQLAAVAGGVRPQPRDVPPPLREARAAMAEGDAARVERLLAGERRAALAPAQRAEAGWLLGAALRALRRGDEATAVWQDVARALPDEPYAWKAAAEAEGHGPGARGIEILTALPEAALRSSLPSTQAPADLYDEAALWQRGGAFLVAMQDASGGYSDSRYDFGGSDSLPNVHFAITALVASALAGAPRSAATDAARRAAFDFVLDDGNLQTRDGDEIVWAHVYRIEMVAADAGDERARAALQRSAAALLELQERDGAWFHEYANPFVTASVLSALRSAQQHAAVALPEPAIERGVRALLACRAQSGGYSYYQARSRAAASVAGSACRMPRCELALADWRPPRADLLRAAVEASFAHHEALEAVRKYDDHADAHGHGGFFFWYDMLARTDAIVRLGDRELAARQRALILSIPEIDGCFVDSHELGRVYGTASALLCLAKLRRLVE
jgi:hypothetical protein